MKHVIVGTAGHVDHGKTALVKALSGHDTDRLKEEKERGISIDLGFAHLPLDDKTDASIVDVPGHERFLKNMLAGVGGIDIALLIVAADEGIMPQTTEHLSMLDFYGIQSGIVVITKIDKVDTEWIELIKEEIRSHTADSFLADAPIHQVSAVTGEGIEGLRRALLTLANTVLGRDDTAPFRLWVDRVFSVKGHGVVVTGSILSGNVVVSQTLQLNPGGVVLKVRGLETHGKLASKAVAGQRVAINLSGINRESIRRGMLLTSMDRSWTSRIWDVATNWRLDIRSGTRIRLHVGTGEWIGRVRLPRFLPPGVARISLEQEMAGGSGERGIVRLYSPQTLVGGIKLLTPSDVFEREALPALADSIIHNSIEGVINAIATTASKPQKTSDVLRAIGYYPDAAYYKQLKLMEENGALLRIGESMLGSQSIDCLANKLIHRVKQLHANAPSSAGMPKEEGRQYLGLDEKWFDHLLETWGRKKLLESSGAVIALPGHAAAHSERLNEAVQKLENAFGYFILEDIDNKALAQVIGKSVSETKPIYDNLLKSGDLVRLGDIIVYRKTLQYNVTLIQEFLKSSQSATVAQLRDLLKVSRKMAIPVLEYCDMNKYTVREGDNRVIGPRIMAECAIIRKSSE